MLPLLRVVASGAEWTNSPPTAGGFRLGKHSGNAKGLIGHRTGFESGKLITINPSLKENNYISNRLLSPATWGMTHYPGETSPTHFWRRAAALGDTFPDGGKIGFVERAI